MGEAFGAIFITAFVVLVLYIVFKGFNEPNGY